MRWSPVMLVVLAACDVLTGGKGGGAGGGAKVAESGMAQGSAGGFSATMSAELARAGVGEPTITAPPPAAPTAGSGSAATTVGSASTPAGSASATGSSAAAPAPTGTSPTTAAASTPAAGSSAAPPTAAAATTTTTAAATPAVATPSSTSAKPGSATSVGAIAAPSNRSYIKPSGDIAAIKLDLEPNWDRDVGEAGTFSLVVKLPSSNDTRLFSVKYGYEDQSAPPDCDGYKKFLEDHKMMHVTLDRQRGAACYIEGTDQGGAMAFRYMLTYGGKRLMCHGSLYKDPASQALGDLRDKVLMQAKKICESLAL